MPHHLAPGRLRQNTARSMMQGHDRDAVDHQPRPTHAHDHAVRAPWCIEPQFVRRPLFLLVFCVTMSKVCTMP
jgi:hypothetical protein